MSERRKPSARAGPPTPWLPTVWRGPRRWRRRRERWPPPPPAKPGAPGPFGLSDKERTERVLSKAGFREINVEPLKLELSAGASRPFDELFQELIQIGPAAALIAESDPTLAEQARTAVYEKLTEFYSPGSGVEFDANFWLVSARR